MALLLPNSGTASPTSIRTLIEEFGELPSSYREFLRHHNGAVPPENVLRGTDNKISVRTFLDASDIINVSHGIDGLSSGLVPIAEDESGNFICIGAKDHQIYFWDHEVDRNEVIAESFGEFLERLDNFDISTVRLRPDQIKRVWINPDFNPEF